MDEGLTPDQAQLVRDFTVWCRTYVEQKFRPYDAGRDDLYQQGMIGLIQAARKFDPSRGVHFSVYAKDWIYSSVSQYMRRDHTIVQPYREMRQGEAYPYTFTPTEQQFGDQEDNKPASDRLIGELEPGYEAVEEASATEWVAGVMERYGQEVVDYFHDPTPYDETLDWQSKAMVDEIREGL